MVTKLRLDTLSYTLMYIHECIEEKEIFSYYCCSQGLNMWFGFFLIQVGQS